MVNYSHLARSQSISDVEIPLQMVNKAVAQNTRKIDELIIKLRECQQVLRTCRHALVRIDLYDQRSQDRQSVSAKLAQAIPLVCSLVETHRRTD